MVARMKRDWGQHELRFRALLERDPDNPLLQAELGMALLGQGRWADGFRLYSQWRRDPVWSAKGAHDCPLPRWAGEDLAGKTFLIHAEDGHGDEIMRVRFGRRLGSLGARVLWLCYPPLARLFSRCGGVEAVPLSGQVQISGDVDFYCPSGDLPNLFFPPLEEPPGSPYLDPPPANLAEGLRIGVMTNGNPKFENDAHRSLPPELAAELLKIPGAFSLAPEHTGARDFYDTATVIAGLDLVISVDTAVAHLAGALGKPVWILIPAAGTDWRWMSDRSDSPWYATARLFRQPAPGRWAEVVEQVVASVRGHGPS
jgi:hypothetical protein